MSDQEIKKEGFEEGLRRKRISIDWGRQGGVFIAYTIIILGFYGIIANTVMINEYNEWIPFTDLDGTLLIWPYLTGFWPFLLLFFVCFGLTYKEDIPAYGIKASIWLVPIIIAQGFLFYWAIFGFSLEPFILLFSYLEGYINLMFLFLIVITGSLLGMVTKKLVISRKERIY